MVSRMGISSILVQSLGGLTEIVTSRLSPVEFTVGLQGKLILNRKSWWLGWRTRRTRQAPVIAFVKSSEPEVHF